MRIGIALLFALSLVACGDSDGDGGSNFCLDVLECEAACPDDENWDECSDGCFELGADEMAAFNDLMSCAFSTECSEDDVDCLMEACPEEMAACGSSTTEIGAGGNGGGNGGGGDGTCAEIFECYGQCEDSSCVDACYQDASPSARQGFDAYRDCVEGCGEDPACPSTECMDEMLACVGTGG